MDNMGEKEMCWMESSFNPAPICLSNMEFVFNIYLLLFIF